MSMFTVRFPDGLTKQFVEPVSGRALLPYVTKDSPEKVFGLKVNNMIVPLNYRLDVRAHVEPVLRGTREGSNIYRRTLCLVLAAAARKVYPSYRLLVGHSLGYGYYYTFEGKNAKKISLADIESEMRAMVAADIPIETRRVAYEEALELFAESNQPDTLRLMQQASKPWFLINTLADYSDLYFQPLMDRIGAIQVFELLPYGDGFLLRFPPTRHPDRLADFHDIPHLFTIYREYKEWGKRIGVSSVSHLNQIIEKRRIKEYVEISETLQNNKLAAIAAQIQHKKTARLVLIAGPSSSGKTTTAKKLSMQLRVLGLSPHIIGLDNFYRGADQTPLGADGKPDYECLEAFDIELLNTVLLQLCAGEETIMPLYDFKTSSRQAEGIPLQLSENAVIILEGIHGLNDGLTPQIDEKLKFKIYLSALTQLNLDDHNRIPTSDNRLLRRIVRDSQFRGSTASRTIGMWGNVRQGEELHIFPYQGNADVMFNTALDYELAILKIYAEPVLRAVKPTQPEYNEASRLLMFLDNFSSVSAAYVPGQSILREFIGDSDFSYH